MDGSAGMCMFGSTILMERLHTSTMFYPVIYGSCNKMSVAISNFLGGNSTVDISVFKEFVKDYYGNIHIHTCLYLGLVLICVFMLVIFRRKVRCYLYGRVLSFDLVLTLYDFDQINNFKSYVEYNKEYYNQMVDYNIGDPDKIVNFMAEQDRIASDVLRGEMKGCSNSEGININFDDKYLGIKGYYVWRKQISDYKIKECEKRVVLRYIEIHITSNANSLTPPEIIKKIQEYNTEKEKRQEICLKYKKLIKRKQDNNLPYEHTVVMSRAKRQPIGELEKKYIHTFFHHERDRLWTMIRNVSENKEYFTRNGQGARISLLMYGPPGTGKSSFAYRVAMSLQRSIISLDVINYTRELLYQVMQNPTNGPYANNVYLLEEFDISIKELEMREKQRRSTSSYYFDIRNRYLEKMGTKRKLKGKKEKVEESNQEKKDKKNEDDIKDDVDDIDDVEDDVDDYKKYSDGCNFSLNTTEFCMRDLLEIFQGPIPLDGMIIMATTNKFDEIKNSCPELFRPGRLTPVYFGYIHIETLHEISRFYFGKDYNGYIPYQIKIPTSQIIEIALESKCLREESGEGLASSHSYFCEKISKAFKDAS